MPHAVAQAKTSLVQLASVETFRSQHTLIEDALLSQDSANFVSLQHLALLQCLHGIPVDQGAQFTCANTQEQGIDRSRDLSQPKPKQNCRT